MKILVTRFSALGDVAMLAPVLKKVLEEHEWISITLLTKSQYVPIFDNIAFKNIEFKNIKRIKTIGIDFSTTHNTPFKLLNFCYRLHREEQFDFYVDIHSVLRTWMMRLFFRAIGLKSVGINKGRKEKKKYINGSSSTPLIHQTIRYLNTFKDACITFNDDDFKPIQTASQVQKGKELTAHYLEKKGLQADKSWIGFAPFAAYPQKELPLKRIKEWLDLVDESDLEVYVLFFGAGKQEKKLIDELLTSSKKGINAIGVWRFQEELDIIASLQLMIGMDSGNVHLASMLGVKTITIWGGTSADLGFSPIFQSPNNHIITNDPTIRCSPCAVFGNKPCHRGDLACLNTINAQQIFDKTRVVMERK